MTDETTPSTEPKLYANKFDSVEKLEEAYNHSAKVYQDNEMLNQKLKEATEVPEDYSVPEGVGLSEEDILEIKRVSKNSNLTQAQYERMAKVMYEKSQDNLNKFDNAKKELGIEKYNLIKDHINNYPEHVREKMEKMIVTNTEAVKGVLAFRNKLLNSTVPGIDKVGASSAPKPTTQAEVNDAWKALQKNKGDKFLKQQYMDKMAAFANQ